MQERIFKNSLFIIGGKLLYLSFSAIASIFLVRYLGEEGWGKISVVYAYLYFFEILAGLGIHNILIRECARSKDRIPLILGNAILLKGLSSLVLILLSWLILQSLDYSQEEKFYIYIASLGLVFSFSTVYEVLFNINLNMKYMVIVDGLKRVLQAFLVIILVLLKAKILYFVLLYVIIQFPKTLVKKILAERYVKPVFRLNFSYWGFLIRESWPILFTAFFTALYLRIDQLMIYKILSEREVGYYNLSARISEFFNIVPEAFMVSVFPLLSSYFLKAPQSFLKIYETSFKYLIILGVLIATLLGNFSQELITFIYGVNFKPSSEILPIMLFSMVGTFIGIVYGRLLISTNHQKIELLFAFVSALINIGLNLFLIPAWGIKGASLSTLICYFLPVFLGLFLVQTRSYSFSALRFLIRPLLASGVVFLILLFIGKSIFSFLLVIPLYLGVLFLLGELTPKDIRFIKNGFKKG